MKNKYLQILSMGIIYFSSQVLFAERLLIIPDVKLKSMNSSTSQNKIAATTFNQTQIAQSPVVSLSQFLKQEQSVVRLTNNSSDPSQTALSIRGFGDNAQANSLILIDGFPLTNPSLLAANFNAIPLSDLNRIEIWQGSAGSLWGNQAVGGVVNLVTQHPKKWIANATLSIGSQQTFYENVLIADQLTHGWFYKIFETLGKTNHTRAHNQESNNNAAIQVGKDYSQGTLSLNLQSYGDLLEFPGGLSEQQFHDNPQQATEYHNHTHYRTNLLQLLSKQQLLDDWLLENRFDYHATNETGFVFDHFSHQDATYFWNPRLLGKIKQHQLLAGYLLEYDHYQLQNSQMRQRVNGLQNHLYLQFTTSLTDQLKLILGTRKAWQNNCIEKNIGESNHQLEQVWVTEQGLTYAFNETLSFFIRHDGNFSFPKANQFTWPTTQQQTLQTQTGHSYETGVKWLSENFQSQLNFYRLELSNEIAFNPEQTLATPRGSFYNFPKTLRQGVSLSHQQNLFTSLMGQLQLNFVDARFAGGPYANRRIPAVPAVNANAGLTYKWLENWALQYKLLYTGSRYASNDLSDQGKRVADFWLSDLAWQYFYRSAIFSIEIQNLFNKSYPNYVFYNTITQQNKYYPAAGRTYMATLKINL